MSNDTDSIEAELAALDAEEGKPPSGAIRRLLPAALAVVTLASFVGVVWYAYSTGMREGSEFAAPTLRPDGPSKVAPENPGGQQIADQDKLVYGKIDKSTEARKVERLLPPPENPLPAMVAAPAPPPALDVPKSPPTSALPPPPSITGPRKASSDNPAKSRPSAKDIAKIASSAGRAVAAKKVVPPKLKPKQVAKKSPPKKFAKPAPKPATGYRIQIGALRSKAAAKAAWQKHVKQNKTVLSKLPLYVNKADLGKKGVYYRVQAGSLKNKAAAQRICDELKQKKVGCFVVAP
jgi:hypothetical protein